MSRGALPAVAVVIPTLDESRTVERCIAAVLSQVAPADEVVVVDGGSRDDTREKALRAGAPRVRVALASRGRALQEAAGVAATRADTILLLHADTIIPPIGLTAIRRAVADGAGWGYFGARLDAPAPIFRLIERGIDLRTRAFLGAPTGDQAIFCRRDVLDRAGGIPRVPVAHELYLVPRLRRVAGRGRRIPAAVETSARRWIERGVLRTTALQWVVRIGCLLGVPPGWAARAYGRRGEGAAATAVPTLLVFARAPLRGRVKSRLAADLGPDRALAVYRALLARTRRLLESVPELVPGLERRVLVDPPEATDEAARALGNGARYRAQAPGDLGARLETGFRDAFADGGGPVVAIGTDCPDLAPSVVGEAFAALAPAGPAGAVLGPATDGGYYLVGLARLAPEVFRAIPWGGPTVLAETLAVLDRLGIRTHRLRTLSDVDRASDLPPDLAAM